MNQTERIGRFEVQERLRSNAFAIIYRGRDPFDGRRVQIKFCVATDESIRRRFLVAAEQAATLRHPNIATVFEFGSGDSKPYLVQEAFSEETLSDLLARREPTEDVFKLYYLMQIARGLQHAHSRKVLHRELRPAAVMVDRSGEAKLADFGTARLASAFAQLGNGAHRWPAVGWLLPELLLGLDLDERSDIYGFGALAFEVLTGRAPFVAESLSLLVPQVLESDPQPVGVHWPECPPELDRLIQRCLSRDPGRRFSSMDELVEEFDGVIPVPESPDYVEQERTLVIEEMQSVACTETDEFETPALEAETDEIAIASLQVETETIEMGPVLAEVATVTEPPQAEAMPTADRQSAQAAFHPPEPTSARVDWSVFRQRLQQRIAELAETSRVTGTSLLQRIRSSQAPTGRLKAPPARWRTAGMVVGALLLSGVVGWSVVRVPDEDLALPTVAPQMPRQAAAATLTGLLVVDSQPWGEVVRVTDQEGQELELPDDRFTPLSLLLEPGRYRIEMTRPELEEVHTCDVVVEPETTSRCEPQLAALEVDDLFRQTGWWQ